MTWGNCFSVSGIGKLFSRRRSHLRFRYGLENNFPIPAFTLAEVVGRLHQADKKIYRRVSKHENVILNLFDYFFQNLRFCEKCPVFPQDFKKIPPTLALPLKGGREELASEAHRKFLVPYCLSNLVSSKKAAFTLAEVLITLGIIGILAAMTIPTLISKYQEKTYITKLKRAYSMLAQAYKFVELEYGSPKTWNLQKWESEEDAEGNTQITSSGSTDMVISRFAKYMKTSKICEAADKDCMEEIDYLRLSGVSDGQHFRGGRFGTMILSDGTIIYNYVNRDNCTTNEYGTTYCAHFYVDLNGQTAPNKRGLDFFEFIMTDNGIIPNGLKGTTSEVGSFERTCNNEGSGDGCTAWVLTFNNMDYLHCDGLSWDGAHSCKDAK